MSGRSCKPTGSLKLLEEESTDYHLNVSQIVARNQLACTLCLIEALATRVTLLIMGKRHRSWEIEQNQCRLVKPQSILVFHPGVGKMGSKTERRKSIQQPIRSNRVSKGGWLKERLLKQGISKSIKLITMTRSSTRPAMNLQLLRQFLQDCNYDENLDI
jgi:hypothetical protein